jgi:hypothetical protein
VRAEGLWPEFKDCHGVDASGYLRYLSKLLPCSDVAARLCEAVDHSGSQRISDHNNDGNITGRFLHC